jgi:NAD(P)H-dependent flavin oxidoreductase YrpB (nitropropane dioxygenase family)
MASPLRTPLCDLLGIDHPILSVGIAAGAGPELAAAVSNTGAFGVVGASGMRPERLASAIERTRSLTRRPFGINLIIDTVDPDEDNAFFRSQIAAAGAAGAKAVVLFWGDPAPLLEAARAAGLVVLVQVGSAEEAAAAAAAGVDAVIAQGLEAGGHVRATRPLWEVLPETLDAVAPLPVLASGGIGDGAGIARALRVGAQGVSLGTRFVACAEANIHPDYQRRIVESSAADTVYTEDLYDVDWPNAPHRSLRNRTYDEWVAAGRPPSGRRPGEGTAIGRRRLASGDYVEWRRYAVGMATRDFEGDLDYAPLWAGESCSVIAEVKPAAEIVAELVRDAEAALAQPAAAARD